MKVPYGTFHDFPWNHIRTLPLHYSTTFSDHLFTFQLSSANLIFFHSQFSPRSVILEPYIRTNQITRYSNNTGRWLKKKNGNCIPDGTNRTGTHLSFLSIKFREHGTIVKHVYIVSIKRTLYFLNDLTIRHENDKNLTKISSARGPLLK